MLDADVELKAHGIVLPEGSYDFEPQSAKLTAWWRDMVMVGRERGEEWYQGHDGADGVHCQLAPVLCSSDNGSSSQGT